MKILNSHILAAVSILITTMVFGEDAHWPQWRGPRKDGMVPAATPPLKWSETENVRWKTPLPGKGHSSPVVWGDRIYVTTAVETQVTGAVAEAAGEAEQGRRRGPRGRSSDKVHRFVVLAIARDTGAILWQSAVHEEMPHQRTHVDGSWASPSPLVDAEHIFAFFGSYGLYCLDHKGVIKWKRDLGKTNIRGQFGEGSSPALHGDLLLVNVDHEGESFLTALDKRTGEPRWRVPRPERTSWTTPLVVSVNGRDQALVSGTQRIRAYDLETGEVLWAASGMTGNVVPMPVIEDGIAYFSSGFRGNAVAAVRLRDAVGEIDGGPAVVWRYTRHAPYTPSPIVHAGRLYLLRSNNAVLTCLNAVTGEEVYVTQQIPGLDIVYASLVGVQDWFYVTSRNGSIAAIRYGDNFEVLATNRLDDQFYASPAVVDKQIILRGVKNLYCLEE